jgi:purine-nucleoside phosphorylase
MSVHINAKNGEIASVVLMPGDPLRAKYIAENWLSYPKLVASTRNIFFYTGTYKDARITIGASGMGCPSIGIYSYELFNEYNVEAIIRIGTAGSYHPHIKLYDVINVENACSESTYAKFAIDIDGDIIPHQGNCYDIINDAAKTLNQSILCGNVHSSDVFYRKNPGLPAIVSAHNCLAVEMEAFALFANANTLEKKAATLLTISDVIPTHEQISADERERSLNPMIELALHAGIQMV